MKALKINTIKQEEIRTTKIIQSRMKGNYDLNTITVNQTNNLLNKICNEDIYTLKEDELKEIGSYIAKIQHLLMLLETNDVKIFTKILENVTQFKKKYSKNDIVKFISKEKYNTKEVFNLRIKTYAYLLELNINTCHFIINKLTSKEFTKFDKLKLTNLIECIWSGLSPDEIKIIFNLSDLEYKLLLSSLYKEKELLFNELGDEYKEWHDCFISCSEAITKILNSRLQGIFDVNTNNTELDINKLTNLYNIKNKESSVLAAEASVKIMFYKKLYASMSLDNLKLQIEEMVKKDHKWTKEQLAEIKKHGKTKTEYIKELKNILSDETNNSLIDMKSQMIASICQLNKNSYNTINDIYINGNDKNLNISFENICNIISLMRSDIKTECIQYMFMLDNSTTECFNKLFKNRIAEKEA